MADRMVYHIISSSSWAAAKASGRCHPESLDKEGFIHLSTAEQVASTANRIFKNQSDLLLLHVDTTKLPQPLKYELAEPNLPPFPHLYCELPLDAVTHVQELKAGEDGLFRFL